MKRKYLAFDIGIAGVTGEGRRSVSADGWLTHKNVLGGKSGESSVLC